MDSLLGAASDNVRLRVPLKIGAAKISRSKN
jgi:hypothetical protein